MSLGITRWSDKMPDYDWSTSSPLLCLSTNRTHSNRHVIHRNEHTQNYKLWLMMIYTHIKYAIQPIPNTFPCHAGSQPAMFPKRQLPKATFKRIFDDPDSIGTLQRTECSAKRAKRLGAVFMVLEYMVVWVRLEYLMGQTFTTIDSERSHPMEYESAEW